MYPVTSRMWVTMARETFLITGATRGIGRGLVSTLLLRPNTTVIAGVRDLSQASAVALNSLPKASDSTLILVKLDSASDTDAATAVATLQEHHITSIDVVIANAAIFGGVLPALSTSPDLARDVLNVNAIAPLVLWQATSALLLKSENPRFFVTSAMSGITARAAMVPFPNFAYGMSKAALNYFVVTVHKETEGVTAVAFHPGLVETDMGRPAMDAAKGMGMEALSVQQSVDAYLRTVDEAKRETVGGKFVSYKREILPW